MIAAIVFIIVGIIAFVIGIAAIYFSKYIRLKYSEQIKRCISTVDGTLIRFKELERIHDDESYRYTELFYYPVYEYWIDGKRYEIESSIGNRCRNDNLIGLKKQILYNPDNCQESLVSGENISQAFKYVKILGIIFMAIGVLGIIFGALLFIADKFLL